VVCSNPPGMPTWGQGQAGSIRNWLAPLSAVVRMDRVNSEPIKHTKPCGVAAPPLYKDLLLQAWPSGFTMPDVASLCVHSGSRDFGDNTCYVLRCLGAVYSITTFIRALTC